MIKKLKYIICDILGIDYLDNDFTDLSDVKPLSGSEIQASEVLKRHPGLSEKDVIQEIEQGWVRF